jgi:ABC-type nitrate/sulfonate/bicarbonate transport system permease component
MTRSLTRTLGILAAFAAFVSLWALASAWMGKPFLPGPVTTVKAFARLAGDGTLGQHAVASARRVFFAVVAAFLPAAALGLAAGRSRRLDSVISPVVYILHPLPKVAFLPVILLIMGIGEASKVFLVGLIIFSQVLVAARDASRHIPGAYFDSIRSLGASPRALAIHVVFPAALPDLLTSLRVSLGTAIAVLFLAETFATEDGLGWLIVDAWARVAYPDMYAAILGLSLLGLLAFLIVDIAERVLCRWKERD